MKKPDSPAANEEPVSTRSVVTFYHEAFDESSPFPIKQEVDLLDYEVLVETYKFLAKNLRKHRQKRLNHSNNKLVRHRRLQGIHREEDNENLEPNNKCNKNNNSDNIVTDRHKQAILTLVEVDRATKRVVRIRPEFFPSNTRALPACLSRLEALKTLSLDHCKELTCLPAGFWLPQLEELSIDITSFQEPFPSSFGNLTKLRTFVVKGNCTSLEHWGRRRRGTEDSVETRDNDVAQAENTLLLFPPSMVKLTNLKHLETHIRNLLQIPSKALDAWSSSLETLVTTQDLLSNSNGNNEGRNFLPPPLRSRSYSTDDSSDDDFYHLMDSSEDEASTDDDHGFSLLKHSSLFRKALESQLEVRAFRAIAKFKNLRSLKLLFDDSKQDLSTIRNRLKRKNSRRQEVPYCVPLSLLAGPLSMSLLELDIGTCVASTTPSSSRKKSKIPIEISWIDVLQDFPMLQKLRLQDCRASFSNKTETVDLTASTMLAEEETVLWMPELRHLILDRCPHFALVHNNSNNAQSNGNNSAIEESLSPLSQPSRVSSFQDDIEIIDKKDFPDDGSEEIVFCPVPGESGDEGKDESTQGNIYFQPLNDADVNAMVEEDPEEISRIIRLSGLLADTILTPKEDDDEEVDPAEAQKLSDLCTMFLRRCPKLEIVSLRDCKIPSFGQELLECLPKQSLRELTLDVLECEKRRDSKTNKDRLWAMVKAYPKLEGLQGTCLAGISDSDREALQRFLRQNRIQNGSNRPHSPNANPWNSFWDKKQKEEHNTNKGKDDDKLLLEIRFPFGEGNAGDENSHKNSSVASKNKSLDDEDRNPPPHFNLLAAIEQKLFFLDRSRRHHHRNTPGASGGRVLQTIRRSNSRDVL